MVSGFVHLLKLGQTLAFANRTIVGPAINRDVPDAELGRRVHTQYATNKTRAQLGHSDQQWEQRIVAELDSALNQWANSLPPHREFHVDIYSFGTPITHG